MAEPTILDVSPRVLAAVREPGPYPEALKRIRPSLDEVWAFLRGKDITAVGHNVFLYVPDAVWFGVEVFAPIPQDERVVTTETPSGRAAMVTHVGSYDGIGGATATLIAWCRANGHALGGRSWEVYGDWAEDPAELRTDLYFLLT